MVDQFGMDLAAFSNILATYSNYVREDSLGGLTPPQDSTVLHVVGGVNRASERTQQRYAQNGGVNPPPSLGAGSTTTWGG